MTAVPSKLDLPQLQRQGERSKTATAVVRVSAADSWTHHPTRIEGAPMSHATNDTSSKPAGSRRAFLAAGGAAAFSFTIVPRHVLGGAGFLAPSDRVNLAGIGAGGMGGGDISTH